MSGELSTSTEQKSVPIAWVEKIFARMAACYGSRFADMWKDVDLRMVQATWAIELGRISANEIKRGYDALVEQEFPPTLPKFLKLCRPPIDPTAAYYEAVNGMRARQNGETGEWSHPAIFWAATKISAFDLLNQTYSTIRQRWETALQDEISRGQWQDIPHPQKTLPAPVKSILDPLQQKQFLQKTLENIVFRQDNGAVDHKAWAKKVMARYEAGDKTLTLQQISFARDALGVGHDADQ